MYAGLRRILWLDNDPFWVYPYVESMKESDYEVKIATSVTEAESCIRHEQYQLLILDVKIPTQNQEEEKIYTPEMTKFGLETGLIFLSIYKESFGEVKDFSVRIDDKARQGDSRIIYASRVAPREFCYKIGAQRNFCISH